MNKKTLEKIRNEYIDELQRKLTNLEKTIRHLERNQEELIYKRNEFMKLIHDKQQINISLEAENKALWLKLTELYSNKISKKLGKGNNNE